MLAFFIGFPTVCVTCFQPPGGHQVLVAGCISYQAPTQIIVCCLLQHSAFYEDQQTNTTKRNQKTLQLDKMGCTLLYSTLVTIHDFIQVLVFRLNFTELYLQVMFTFDYCFQVRFDWTLFTGHAATFMFELCLQVIWFTFDFLYLGRHLKFVHQH